MSHSHEDAVYNGNQLYRNAKDREAWYNGLPESDRKLVDELNRTYYPNRKPDVYTPKATMQDHKVTELHIRAKNALDNLKTESLEPEDDLKMLEYGCLAIERVNDLVVYCFKRVSSKLSQPNDDEVNR